MFHSILFCIRHSLEIILLSVFCFHPLMLTVLGSCWRAMNIELSWKVLFGALILWTTEELSWGSHWLLKSKSSFKHHKKEAPVEGFNFSTTTLLTRYLDVRKFIIILKLEIFYVPSKIAEGSKPSGSLLLEIDCHNIINARFKNKVHYHKK